MARILPTALLPLALALLLPGAGMAQQRRSGPDAPAAGAQIPPSSLPGESQGPPGTQPRPDPRDRVLPPDDPPRTAPPEGHRLLGAPPIPGAAQPGTSEGFTTNRDRIPPRPADRPDASTTGR